MNCHSIYLNTDNFVTQIFCLFRYGVWTGFLDRRSFWNFTSESLINKTCLIVLVGRNLCSSFNEMQKIKKNLKVKSLYQSDVYGLMDRAVQVTGSLLYNSLIKH